MTRKQALSLVLRIGLSLAMLGVLIWRVPSFDASQVVPELTLRTVLWLAFAALLTLAGLVLSALRWQKVLEALGLHTKLKRLLSHYLAGQFVSNVLPTTIGGDVLRVTRLSRDTGESPRSFASVVLERLTGWLVLPVLTLFALAVNPGLHRRAPGPADTAMWLAVVTLAGLAVVMALAASPRLGGRLNRADGWRRFTGAVHVGIDRMRSRPGLAFEILTAGFAYQLAVMLAAFLAAKALGLGVGWTAILAFFPVVAIVQVLPLTVSGLGTREAALVFFLSPLGIAQADAFALGLLVYFVNLGVSLLGAPAFALGTRARAVA